MAEGNGSTFSADPNDKSVACPCRNYSQAKPTPEDTTLNNSELGSLLKQEGFGVVTLKEENLGNQKATRTPRNI